MYCCCLPFYPPPHSSMLSFFNSHTIIIIRLNINSRMELVVHLVEVEEVIIADLFFCIKIEEEGVVMVLIICLYHHYCYWNSYAIEILPVYILDC